MPNLFFVYSHLIGWTLLGLALGRVLPNTAPAYVGKFLYWVGVPIGVLAFLRHAQLSWSLWIAPVAAWIAIFLGNWLASRFITSRSPLLAAARPKTKRSQGSFLLASMVGNTGYIGFPVSLALVGPQYFAWALFYDMLGSMFGAYGLGVALAAQFGTRTQGWWESLQTTLKNPVLLSFVIGLICRDLPLPPLLEVSLKGLGWGMVTLALVLVGMRLSQLSSFRHIKPALVSLGIKMLLVPLAVGTGLWLLGINGPVHRVILLQMAMPPAFATLVIAETYELDQDLTVTTLAIGSLGLLTLLPFWLSLFGG
jgi:hypothetical protein